MDLCASNRGYKAWMSKVDADLFEAVVLVQAEAAASNDACLEILEWGSGASTMFFTSLLANRRHTFRWLSLEYDQGFFDTTIVPRVRGVVGYSTLSGTPTSPPAAAPGDLCSNGFCVELVCFGSRKLRPFSEECREDRLVQLDAYVKYPARVGRQFDVVLVDGRKRRRCIIEASKLLKPGGVIVLHDAHRAYYHCAFAHLRAEGLIGDVLWIGSQTSREELDALLIKVADMKAALRRARTWQSCTGSIVSR
jgi:hypothetical protein